MSFKQMINEAEEEVVQKRVMEFLNHDIIPHMNELDRKVVNINKKMTVLFRKVKDLEGNND